jgi:hypothetical protein
MELRSGKKVDSDINAEHQRAPRGDKNAANPSPVSNKEPTSAHRSMSPSSRMATATSAQSSGVDRSVRYVIGKQQGYQRRWQMLVPRVRSARR